MDFSNIIPFLKDNNLYITIGAVLVWVWSLMKTQAEVRKLNKEIDKISKENTKIQTEVDKLKTEIAKEKIEKVILLAKYKREYFSLIYESVDINKKFNALLEETNRPSEKLRILFDEMDRFIFEKILPSVNEMAMVADYFYSDDIERRVDFIEEIVIPCFVMLDYHFTFFNQPDILKKAKQIETVVYKENLLTTTRFLLSSPDSEPKQYALDLSKKFIKTERVG